MKNERIESAIYEWNSFLIQWEGVSVQITAKRAAKNIVYRKCQITDIHL